MRNGMIALASLAAILLYMLAIATGNASKLEEYYWWVFGLNTLLALALAGAVGRQMLRLRQRVRSRVFGAKLTQKLVMMFALVALVPGVLVFAISAQFLTNSIESWFNVHVETALDRGLDLGRRSLDYALQDVERKSEQIEADIGTLPEAMVPARLERARQQLQLREVVLFSRAGRVLAYAGPNPARATPPAREILRELGPAAPMRTVENDSQNALSLKVLRSYRNLNDESRILQLVQAAPDSIARDAEVIERARADYRGRQLNRAGLKTFYMLTLALAFLLALIYALAFALFMSERLSAPLSELAAGTRAVAQGDFSRRHPVYRRDELGILTSMFNRMTQQLEDARHLADENHQQLESGKLYLESILANLSSGVIALGADWKLRASNYSAERILGIDFSELSALPFGQWKEKLPALAPLEDLVRGRSSDEDDWQSQIEYVGARGECILLLRGAGLPEQAGVGYVVVFDDITELARAQRDAAWGEVAKRLAHEIRNPLTPIQLSAERLAMKLSDRLDPDGAEMLRRSTDTIINQVAALKGMVDAFRDYARSPRIKLHALDLNQVVRDVMTLYESNPAIRLNLHPEPLMIMGDPALLRQVLHNLMQNSQDAVLDVGIPMIQISSRLDGGNAVVCVEDNGTGFASDILPRAFEPYVTNKSKGTGLGLAVVKKIVEEHHGQIVLGNAEPQGARIQLILPLLEA